MARLLFPSPGVAPLSCPRPYVRRGSGFTLVETALALGIVAFALVPLIALLPIGLQASRHASDLTITSQIAQRLSGMVGQDDYTDLKALQNNESNLENNLYYFDSEGQPLTSVGGALPATALYTACIEQAGANATSNTQVNNITTAILVLQIASDPAHLWTKAGAAPSILQARTVTIPVYFGGSGS